MGVGVEILPFQRVGSQSRTEIQPGSQSRSRTEKMAESQSRSQTNFASIQQPCSQLSYITVCRFNNLLILLKYFQKYLYLSTTATFSRLLKHRRNGVLKIFEKGVGQKMPRFRCRPKKRSSIRFSPLFLP